ncbi:hypothetical protein PpBr36_03477 [Pyricularia pennisetigena]|uniref:hypothetical protein n=1 Tax=Pyricularia pennisetigena TaxID=1578925 RepID=UPI00115290BE|nr:hypothetical protein PpBr36_03477 [Pyricularia pennisetigena]TLS31450.1 hypothetical protein PpBr36_03477 [Pyricularia pennisetigena]
MNSWTAAVPIPLHGEGIQAGPVHVNAISEARARFRYPQGGGGTRPVALVGTGGDPLEKTGAHSISRCAFEGLVLDKLCPKRVVVVGAT